MHNLLRKFNAHVPQELCVTFIFQIWILKGKEHCTKFNEDNISVTSHEICAQMHVDLILTFAL